MEQYLIRIELNGQPSAATYQALHAALAARRAYRTVVDLGGTHFHLPHATYCALSTWGTKRVHDDVLAVAHGFWRDVEVFVARFEEAVFTLRPVRASAAA